MRALQRRYPGARFLGVGGPAMVAAGLESLAPFEALSVNGFRDPLLRLPDLLKLLLRLDAAFAGTPVCAFIGIDFNVFNLLLERRLRKRGFATVHYVSPSVYAWRRGRVRSIARAARLLLTLYPFEPAFYRSSPIETAYVGHPLADQIPLPAAAGSEPRRRARQALGIDPAMRCLALLPGSRGSELTYHLPVFLGAAQLVSAQLAASTPAPVGGPVTWIIPCPRPSLRGQIEAAIDLAEREHRSRQGPGVLPLSVRIDDGTAQRALQAAEAALIKSGTSTLEALLLRCPMVVSYRLGAITHAVVKRLVHARYFALPNILAGRELVPELIQDAATPESLAAALLQELARATADPNYFATFDELHTLLRRDANEQAARAVSDFLERSVRLPR